MARREEKPDKSYTNLVVGSAVFVSIELIIVGVFVVFLINDLFGLKTFLFTANNEYIFIMIVVGLIILNAIYSMIVIHSIVMIKGKSDLTSAELLGAGVDEAYSQGKLGLIVVDRQKDDLIIVWANSFLINRYSQIGKTIINHRIKEIFPNVKTDTGLEYAISDNNYSYRIKYLADSGLFILVDSTDYHDLKKKYDDEAIVLGTLRIDNYRNDSRLRGNVSTLSEVKRVIALYFQKYNVSITQTQEDSFELVLDHETLDTLVRDQFSILDDVKHVDKDTLTTSVTVSIGLACGIPSVPKLDEMASDALKEALARGGDQAVVSEFGKPMKFIGGRTLAKSMTNNANTRNDADEILSVIDHSEDIFIMGHRNTDLDAFGSAVGLYEMCKYKGKNARVVFEKGLSGEDVKNLVLNDYGYNNEMLISAKDAIKVAKERSNVLVIVTDVSSREMVISPELLDVYKIKILIVDHHQPGVNAKRIENPLLQFINPTASSASEMVANYIKYCSANPKIIVDPRNATAMLAGILLDTDSYIRDTTTPATYEASMYLRECGADNQKAAKLIVGSKEEFMLLNKYLSLMSIVSSGIAYVMVDEGGEPVQDEFLSKVADNLIRIRDIKASFVLGRTGQRNKPIIKISARSDGTVNVGKFMQIMGGGGRFNAAAGTWPNVNLKDKEKELLKAISEHIDECKNIVKEEK